MIWYVGRIRNGYLLYHVVQAPRKFPREAIFSCEAACGMHGSHHPRGGWDTAQTDAPNPIEDFCAACMNAMDHSPKIPAGFNAA